MLRWIAFILGSVIVVGGFMVFSADFYQRFLDPRLLAQRALMTSLSQLQATHMTFEGTVMPLDRSDTPWTFSLQDGTLTRRKSGMYNWSGDFTIENDVGELKKTLTGGIVLNYGNLYLRLDQLTPFSSLVVLPIQTGIWMNFAAAQDYEDVIWNTYLSIPLRDRFEKRYDDIVQAIGNADVLQTTWTFIPNIWWKHYIVADYAGEYSVAFDQQKLFRLLADLHQQLTLTDLTDEQSIALQFWTQAFSRGRVDLKVNSDGLITQIRYQGPVPHPTEPRWEMQWFLDLTDINQDDVFVRSPQGFQAYRDILTRFTQTYATGDIAEEINPSIQWSWSLDSDADGLVNVYEKFFGTNQEAADTDADGYSDLDEIRNGYSPFIAAEEKRPRSMIEKEEEIIIQDFQLLPNL